MTTPSFRERLREILQAVQDGLNEEAPLECKTMTVEDALSEILALVREEIPLPWSLGGSEPELAHGWNRCRSQILKNLGEE